MLQDLLHLLANFRIVQVEDDFFAGKFDVTNGFSV